MLTTSGKTFLAIGALALFVGVALGYQTLSALGIAFLIAVVIARLWIVRRPRVSATRVVKPERVRSGREARSNLTITNQGRRRTSGGVALEAFGQTRLAIDLPSLEPGESVVISTDLPTDRRGVFRVGPLDVTRADPFGLMRSGEPDEGLATLYVHPVIHEVEPFPSGLARDLDGPDSGEALDGGVTFHSLREYVRGDDLRLIHWRSSARSNKLMVRHNIDSHQPRSLVVLDTRATVHTADGFEDAVRAAASLAAASVSRNFDFRLITTEGLELNQMMPAATIMDRLAQVGLSLGGSLDGVFDELMADLGGVSLTLLTGATSAEELGFLNRFRNRFDVITVGQFVAGRDDWERGIADGILLTASSSEEFARAWNRTTR